VYERGGTGDDGEEGGELSENLIFLLHWHCLWFH
jgi:hypothetical protein